MNDVVQCPRCNISMREREKGDVVIDICPQCRGVWLDAGELERLGERESRYYDDDDDDDWEKRSWQDRDPRRDDRRVQEYRGQPGGNNQQYQQRPHKKKGFLSGLMENFGGEGGDD
jgi:Zn-finger nucleic acid-binding protein